MQKNYLLFFVLSAVIFLGWMSLAKYIWPPPPQAENAQVASKDDADKPKGDDKKTEAKKKTEQKKDDKKPDDKKKGDKKPPRAVASSIQTLPATPEAKLIALGEKDRASPFHLFVQLDPLGAGVRSLTFNKFQAADYLGRPEWEDEGKKVPRPLELVPAELNKRSPSFLLYAFDVNDPTDDKPLDRLGRINWTVLDKKTDETDDKRRRESVSFQAESQGAIVTKTYTLTEGEYHLGLEVKMRRGAGADKSLKFRYQMAGAHGLPVEGKWYTSIFRNALIARVDKDGNVGRDLQDLRQISHWEGGNEVRREENNSIIYAVVANQYFASGIVVDNDQKNRAFLRQARPTLETALTKGVVKSVAEDGSSFVFKPAGGVEGTFYVPEERRAHIRELGKSKDIHLAVLYHTGSYNEKTHEYPEIATAFLSEDELPALWVDDITVRVSTEPVELKDDEEIVHKYLLYNGPVKVNQLSAPLGLSQKSLEDGGVDPALVHRYHDELHLNTLTDYHSPGAMGKFASTIYWTDLVIWFTNLMHRVLAYLHAVIPSYGLCIIVLTILVRGMMFPLSRKQAMMSMRMQQLAPELKKLQEKYKDDRQALGIAQMEMYRKHGVNPFGSCWVLLLQMPIFMGLYFALQESIHFRLAECWPWITNLAAPDMLFSWSQNIPYLSRVQDYGSFFYLGPYFNLLPVIAVILMIGQQKMMTPPPADEQQAMQQKMMKYMMVFFGLMFYKVAAGLCLYFIASSVWGFCERKLLPKKKPVIGEISSDGYFQKMLRRARGEQVTETVPSGSSTGTGTVNGGITPASSLDLRGRSGGKRGRNKRRQAPGTAPETGMEDSSALGRLRKRLRDWWTAILKEAEKKNRG